MAVAVALLAFVFCVGVALATYPELSRAQIAVEDAKAAMEEAVTGPAAAAARLRYNEAAHRLNTEMARFPTRIVTRTLAFVPAPYLDGYQPPEQPPSSVLVGVGLPAALAAGFVAAVVLLMRRRVPR